MKITKEYEMIINKYLIKLLIIASLIIIFSSIEALMLAKSRDFFEAYLQNNPNTDFDEYIGLVIINFFGNIFEPLLISLFTFFTYKKFGITKVYKIVFGIIVLLKIINIVLKFQLTSIFYYLILVFYILFLIIILLAPTRKKVQNDIFKTNIR